MSYRYYDKNMTYLMTIDITLPRLLWVGLHVVPFAYSGELPSERIKQRRIMTP